MSIGVPIEAVRAAPTINYRHIDGPLLEWAGQMHWLTWRERWAVWRGKETAESLAQKHWPARRRWVTP